MERDSSHMQAPDAIKKIEDYIFHKGVKNFAPPTLFSILQDQMLFLFSTKGILRGDSIFKSELLDFFHLKAKKHGDPHPLTVLIMQFATGKSNKGVKLYGQVARHVDVILRSSLSVGVHDGRGNDMLLMLI